ncbi:hypothetical protein HNR71_004331 [Kribbella sandramycini]|uniref:Uncharacterized protein n=1 Tax=Kribbella sandramycini TaxID=60450 RepID=A0A841SFX7_9ACTN|nr:hypothetical protein [Kribbella sandramycini]
MAAFPGPPGNLPPRRCLCPTTSASPTPAASWPRAPPQLPVLPGTHLLRAAPPTPRSHPETPSQRLTTAAPANAVVPRARVRTHPPTQSQARPPRATHTHRSQARQPLAARLNRSQARPAQAVRLRRSRARLPRAVRLQRSHLNRPGRRLQATGPAGVGVRRTCGRMGRPGRSRERLLWVGLCRWSRLKRPRERLQVIGPRGVGVRRTCGRVRLCRRSRLSRSRRQPVCVGLSCRRGRLRRLGRRPWVIGLAGVGVRQTCGRRSLLILRHPCGGGALAELVRAPGRRVRRDVVEPRPRLILGGSWTTASLRMIRRTGGAGARGSGGAWRPTTGPRQKPLRTPSRLLVSRQRSQPGRGRSTPGVTLKLRPHRASSPTRAPRPLAPVRLRNHALRHPRPQHQPDRRNRGPSHRPVPLRLRMRPRRSVRPHPRRRLRLEVQRRCGFPSPRGQLHLRPRPAPSLGKRSSPSRPLRRRRRRLPT